MLIDFCTFIHGFHYMHYSSLSCHCDLYMWHPLHIYSSEREGLLLCGFIRFLLFPCQFFFLLFYCWSRRPFIFIPPKNMFRFIKRMTISSSSRLKYSNVLLFTVAIVTCSSIKVGFLCWLFRCTTQSEPLWRNWKFQNPLYIIEHRTILFGQ